MPGVHHQHRGQVVDALRPHRPHHEDVVDARADPREDVADLDAALAVGPELEGRLHESAGGPVRLDLRPGHRLSIKPGESRFRVERVDMRQPAVEVQEDDAFRPRGEMRGVPARRHQAVRQADGSEAGPEDSKRVSARKRHEFHLTVRNSLDASRTWQYRSHVSVPRYSLPVASSALSGWRLNSS